MLTCVQVARLKGYGINTCYYNTLLSDDDRKNILHNLEQPDCQYQVLFISPEAVITDSFQSCLDALRRENRLEMFVVDEVHCIDTCGKDFRPAHQQFEILNFTLEFSSIFASSFSTTLIRFLGIFPLMLPFLSTRKHSTSLLETEPCSLKLIRKGCLLRVSWRVMHIESLFPHVGSSQHFQHVNVCHQSFRHGHSCVSTNIFLQGLHNFRF